MKKKHKVLLIGWYFYPSVGGVETIMLEQLKHFEGDDSFELIVLTGVKEGSPAEEMLYGTKIFREGFLDPNSEFNEADFSKDFNDFLEKAQPDLIHFHNASFPFLNSVSKAVAMYNIAKSKKIKCIEHSHGPQYHDIYATGAIRDLEWDGVICNSKFVRDSWLALGSRARKYFLVYNGIDLKYFVDAKPKDEILELKKTGKKIIFFPARDVKINTGEVLPRKNFLYVLKGCQRLVEKGVDDFILLTLSYENSQDANVRRSLERLDSLLERYGLSQNTVRVPAIPAHEMGSYYSACDIVCVPSLYEAFGLVFVEAMAAGVAVVGPNQGGPKEIIDNGKDGLLVNPYRVDELEQALSKLLKDEKFALNIARKAKMKSKKFTSQVMVENIKSAYKRVI